MEKGKNRRTEHRDEEGMEDKVGRRGKKEQEMWDAKVRKDTRERMKTKNLGEKKEREKGSNFKRQMMEDGEKERRGEQKNR